VAPFNPAFSPVPDSDWLLPGSPVRVERHAGAGDMQDATVVQLSRKRWARRTHTVGS
jgi:hypothetical protein